ncbi:MAG TPA: amidohydrolase family protein [Thermoplasmata archaeon]|nr:amidohydrolase family protein [Thermoplasmata archaeon]
MLVEGAIVDLDGIRPGYVRFDGAQVVETGQLGTASRRVGERRIRGIVVPPPANGHTHLGDASSTVEPPASSVAEMVQPPDGFKFRLLRDTSARRKAAGMRRALERMRREGIAATVDFREEGVVGVRLLREAARDSQVEVVVLGRPVARPLEEGELAELLHESDGVGLSAARDEPPEALDRIAAACRSAGKRLALHASEAEREDPESYLRTRPDLLVHLTCATVADLEQVRAAGSTVAVCARSNALFGRRPPLAELARLGVPTMLGTDNAMLHAPSVWRELEFDYVSSRLAGAPVAAEFLARAAFVEPWRWLGRASFARVAPGTDARPIVVRLPPDDPAYQLVTRATEHLIVRPGSRRSEAAST